MWISRYMDISISTAVAIYREISFKELAHMTVGAKVHTLQGSLASGRPRRGLTV